MENIPLKLNINKINSDNSDKKHPFSPNNLSLKHKSSKSQKKKGYCKYCPFHKKDFLKNKRKNKIKLKNDIPDTPHNTGQYLCHIYQSNESRAKQKENGEGELESGLNFFDDDEEDLEYNELGNFEFKYNEDSKRERLMSLEGKELQNFLFTPEENNDKKEIFKSAITFNKLENNFDLDFPDLNDSPMIEEKK